MNNDKKECYKNREKFTVKHLHDKLKELKEEEFLIQIPFYGGADYE
ncbi:MAG: hypothetical protein Q4D45_11915 [Lachnospiraceae bacterium]|nr:hypothetical protein [Lachnospiraceae bacterium]